MKKSTASFSISLIIAIFVLILSNFSFGQTDSWHIYKEAPETLIPVQIESSDDGTLYLMSKSRKMYYREVDDASWTEIANISSFWNSTTFAVNPINKRIFLGTENQGIQMSDNYGDSWQHEYFFTIPNSGTHAGIHSLAFDLEENLVILGGGVNVQDFAWFVYRSFNNGDSWETIVLPCTFCTFSSLHLRPNGDLLASSQNSGLYLSEDQGLSWSNIGMSGLGFSDFAEVADGTLYATAPTSLTGFETGVYTSSDGGLSWSLNNQGLLNTAATCIEYIWNTNEVLVGTYDGLYQLNSGIWEPTEIPHSNPGINEIREVATSLYLGTEIGGVDKKDLPQNPWLSYNQGFKGGVTDYLFNQQGALLATYNRAPGFFRSNTSSDEWMRFNTLPQDDDGAEIKVFQMEKSPAGNLFFLDFDELFLSIDHGESFFDITPSIPLVPGTFYTRFDKIDVSVEGELMFHQFDDNHIYLSTDNGLSFDVLLEPEDSDNGIFIVEEMLNSETLGYLTTILDESLDRKLLRSPDGIEWHEIIFVENPEINGFFKYTLDLMEDGQVIFSNGHRPYRLHQDETLEALSVPWLGNGNNSVYEFSSDDLGTMFISVFPTFGSLDYDGVWRSTNQGESWVNIGFPIGGDGEGLYSAKVRFDDEGHPFILYDAAVAGSSSSLDRVRIYYYGADDIFTSTDELYAGQSKGWLYPNPVGGDGVVTLKSSWLNKESEFFCYDLQGRKLQIEAQAAEGYAHLRLMDITKGVYVIHARTSQHSFSLRLLAE